MDLGFIHSQTCGACGVKSSSVGKYAYMKHSSSVGVFNLCVLLGHFIYLPSWSTSPSFFHTQCVSIICSFHQTSFGVRELLLTGHFDLQTVLLAVQNPQQCCCTRYILLSTTDTSYGMTTTTSVSVI